MTRASGPWPTPDFTNLPSSPRPTSNFLLRTDGLIWTNGAHAVFEFRTHKSAGPQPRLYVRARLPLGESGALKRLDHPGKAAHGDPGPRVSLRRARRARPISQYPVSGARN